MNFLTQLTAHFINFKAMSFIKDGNSWDTFGEVMFLKGDTTRFYNYLEKALQNRNPTEGITAEVYANDRRWEHIRTEKKFQNLLKKYKKIMENGKYVATYFPFSILLIVFINKKQT